MLYTFLLFVHFVGLAMGVGTGFAILRIGYANRRLQPAEMGALMQKVSVLRLNGYTGFALLIASGLGMLAMRPFMFTAGGGALHAKLTLVVLMVANIGVMHSLMAKAKRAGGPPPKLLMKLGNLNFAMGLVTILLAVAAFH
jgi:uncharacterized membrane protein